MAANIPSTLTGLFYEVYAKQLENLIPEGIKLLNRIEFDTAASTGNAYH